MAALQIRVFSSALPVRHTSNVQKFRSSAWKKSIPMAVRGQLEEVAAAAGIRETYNETVGGGFGATSPNLLERFNQKIKRRTLVVRIFPDEASCLCLVRAVAAETTRERMEGSCYLNADRLCEQIKPMKNLMTIAA